MNIWEVEFQIHYEDMNTGEWDKNLKEESVVVASDYESALATAKPLALAESWYDDENSVEVHADDVRLLSIIEGQSVDAIAKDLQPA
jgi:hypothetical protein